MAYTRDQYNKLCAALSTGATFVKYADKEVHYRSLAEMQELKRNMEVDLGLRSRSRKTIAVYSSGLGSTRRPVAGCATSVVVNVNGSINRYSVTVAIKDVPDPNLLIDIGNDIRIYAQYAPGRSLTLRIYNADPSAETGFLLGKILNLPVIVTGNNIQLIDFNSTTGAINNYDFLANDTVTINYSLK
jgi:hypothetical protein